jgi:hypothetical protein
MRGLIGVHLTGVHLTGMLLTGMHLAGDAQVIERVSDSVLIAFMLIASCSCLRPHAFILSYLYAFSLRKVTLISNTPLKH